MADDRFEPRATHFRESLQWTELFKTFRIALDPKKLVVAAAGILLAACGWWVISWVFYIAWSQPKKDSFVPTSLPQLQNDNPGKSSAEYEKMQRDEKAKLDYQYDESLDRWLQLHYLAGSGEVTVTKSDGSEHRVWGGRFRTLPWDEDRGANPYLLVTGRERPWEKGGFVSWFLKSEVPVLLEPLIKFLEPIVYLLSPKTGTYTRLYLLAIILWTLATWALFGGVITRIAAVELAGKEPVGIKDAFRFIWRRYASYMCAPLVPFALMAVLVAVGVIFAALHMIPFVGDIFVSGLLWPIPLLLGLGMALLLVGLVGYPMMYPTISVEASDTLDALSRSYNYVYQSPWQYIWYSMVSICYGAVVVFFVGLMGSLTAYLGQWAMSNMPYIESANRGPQFLFIYTPTSFGWRQLLLEGSPGEKLAKANEEELELLRLSDNKKRGAEYDARLAEVREKKKAADEQHGKWLETFWVYNKIGAGMVAFWITLLFLMVLGFGYSFFWTTSTMIYLLMRKKVDDTDLDEVYLDEEETTDIYGRDAVSTLPLTAPPPPSAPVMVDLNVKTEKPAAPPGEPGAANETPPPPPAEPTGNP